MRYATLDELVLELYREDAMLFLRELSTSLDDPDYQMPNDTPESRDAFYAEWEARLAQTAQ